MLALTLLGQKLTCELVSIFISRLKLKLLMWMLALTFIFIKKRQVFLIKYTSYLLTMMLALTFVNNIM
jgi:hypothetical protein